MDTMPPTPPPAIVRSVDQDAVDAVQRVIDVERWLNEQQSAMPALPETFDHATLASFLGEVDAFWAAQPTPATASTGVSRRSALETRLASAMMDLAILLAQDGSLPEDARRLATRVAAAGDTPPPGVELREVTVGDTAYAGILLVVDAQATGKVLAFTSTRGWDVYPDLDRAHAAIGKHARRMLTWRVDLPGMARGTLEQDGDAPTVGSRPLDGRPFDTFVGRIVATQHAKVEQAWIEYELDKGSPSRGQRLSDRLRDAIRISELFDVEAILGIREARLRQVIEDERLAGVPAPVAAAWRRTRNAYVDTLRLVSDRQARAGAGSLPDLKSYTVEQLSAVLTALGVTDEPTDITLTLDRSLDPAARFESLSSLFSGPAPVHASLLDAAYRNVPSAGAGWFSARGKDGEVITSLNDKSIRILLNRLNVHTRYQALLVNELRDGPQATSRRRAFGETRAARMRHDAAEARLAELRSTDDRRRGLSDQAWRQVNDVLDAVTPDSRPGPVEQGRAVARQVAYLDVPIHDVVEIGLHPSLPSGSQGGVATSLVYYTPDAPDDIPFREFSNRDDAEERFFRHPAFRDYLLDRLPAEFAETTEGGARRFKANRRTQWVFGGNLPSGYTQTAGPFVPRDITVGLFDALYDTALDHALRDVRELTRSTAQANRDFVIDAWHSNPAHAIPAQVVIGNVTASFRIAPAAWRGYDAIKAGDYGQAFVDVSESYVMALAAYSLGSAGRYGTVDPYTVHFRALGGTLVSRAMARPAPTFNARYLAEGVTKKGLPDVHGLYRIDGKHYAAIEGRLYYAHYDAPNRTVRLGAERPLDPGAAGPAIRLQNEIWQPERSGIIRSSLGPSPDAGLRPTDFYSEYVNQLERAFPDTLERQLVSDHMYLELRGLPMRRVVTAGQRASFHAAVDRAERAIRTSFNIGPSLPGRLRRVAEDAIPERLWFYDEKPVRESSFFSASSPGGEWGALRPDSQARDIVGVRVTSVSPEAATSAIAAGSGLLHLERAAGFAVELRVRDIVRAQGNGVAPVELLSIVGTQGTQYVLRTAPPRPLMLEAGQFRLIDDLPPDAPP